MSTQVGDGSVVQEWVRELPWKQQTVLFAAIRGCDGVSKHDRSKAFVRPLRGIILKDAEPDDEDDTFMKEIQNLSIMDFAHDIDDYPMHWLLHFTHAVEIVGYKHPDPEIRSWWKPLYFALCREGFHMNPENEEQLDDRLDV